MISTVAVIRGKDSQSAEAEAVSRGSQQRQSSEAVSRGSQQRQSAAILASGFVANLLVQVIFELFVMSLF